MTITFGQIPANLQVPGTYAEIEAAATAAVQPRRFIALGPKLSGGTAPDNELQLLTSAAQADTLFGIGSYLARMARRFFAANPGQPLRAVGIPDDGGATDATGTIVVTAAATAAGTLSLYIGGQLVEVAMTGSQNIAQTADAIAAAIPASSQLPVTASSDGVDTVTLTAKHGGTLGNGIDVRLNALGQPGGEVTPTGFTATITEPSGGATDPALTTALAAIAEEPYATLISAWSTSAALAAIDTHIVARWGYSVGLYGAVIAAADDSVANLVSAASASATTYGALCGIEDSPTPTWELAALVAATAGQRLHDDPAANVAGVELPGTVPPDAGDRFAFSDVQTLITSGISPLAVNSAGNVYLAKAVTIGTSSTSAWFPLPTPYSVAYAAEYILTGLAAKFAGYKLANDGTTIPPGSKIATPAIVRAEALALYRDLTPEGSGPVAILENFDYAIANTVATRNVTNPQRVDLLQPLDLINQLEIIATLLQFGLQL